MATSTENITQRLHAAIDQVPVDRREALLKIVHAYQEAVDDDIEPAESIRQGLADIREGRTHSIETLWEGVEGT